MEAPVRHPDVLDAGTPPDVPRAGVRGWAVGLLAAASVVTGLVVLRPSQDPGDLVALSLVDHTGSALHGQRFVRFYFTLAADGGDAEVEQVEMVLGGARQAGVAPAVISEHSPAQVLVDVVPQCPAAVRELPAGTLEVTYRAGGDPQVAHLPLPIQGPLPRLVQRRCDQLEAR